jgi:hypothetical protein
LLESKDSLLTYTDKKDLNLSRGRQLEDLVKKSQTQKVPSPIDLWGKVAAWALVMTLLAVVERSRESSIDAGLKILLVLIIEAVLQLVLNK